MIHIYRYNGSNPSVWLTAVPPLNPTPPLSSQGPGWNYAVYNNRAVGGRQFLSHNAADSRAPYRYRVRFNMIQELSS